MKRHSVALFVVTGLLCLGATSLASPITFTLSFEGEGSIGGTPFSWTTLTITAAGDTVNRVAWSEAGATGYSLNLSASSIAIAGVGSFGFAWPTAIHLANTNPGSDWALDFATSYVPGGAPDNPHVILGKYPALSTWDMLTSLGPMTATDTTIDNSEWAYVMRSGGTTPEIFAYDSGSVSWPAVTFQATVTSDATPEPRSWRLLVLGLAGVILFVSRRPAPSTNSG